jgi:type IV pilus assembly protein PilW
MMNIGNMHSRQLGVSLMEVLVAMSISLVVTASMVALMANSLANTARIIKMTKLTDDMRTAMQMMSRDVRRSSYTATAVYCYGNPDCGSDSRVTLADDISFNDTNSCFTFLMDRGFDGHATNDGAGGFRRRVISGVGVIEMWIGDASPDCTSTNDANWVAVTNPDEMDITSFVVNDALSYTEEVNNDGAGTIISHKVRRILMNMQGKLVMDPNISREIEDVINVRNDLIL